MNDIVTGFKWVGTRPIRPDGVPKVTGRAMYAADYTMAGAIIGKILRSPHAHARIRSINTSKAEKLPGVKAVITAKDFPEQKFEYIGPERVAVNFWHVTRNIMAREKTLYEGHAVAAVAAIDAATADEALSLIEVDYEVLPHVIDVDEAMNEDAPLLFEDMITRGVEPTPTKPSNISKRLEFKIGDLDAGWARADVIVEEEFKTAAVHQGYIEPHACCVRVDPDGQTEVWSSSQGHFVVRALTAKLLNKPVGDVRCSPAEIGGGFGGKTVVYLEPVAALLSQKTGRPIKMTMTRDEVFKATGPTSGGSMWVKMGVTKDGKITAADGIFKFQAGAFPGSPVMNACLCAFAPYAIENARSVGVLVTYGHFRFLDLGDLTKKKELELACPNNLIGTVDLFLVTHHGADLSNSKALDWSLHPRVAVINNGPRKGASPAAWQIVHDSPGLQDVWQLHYAEGSDKAHNTDPERIANIKENCEGKFLKVTAENDGSFTVINGRTGAEKKYSRKP